MGEKQGGWEAGWVWDGRISSGQVERARNPSLTGCFQKAKDTSPTLRVVLKGEENGTFEN